ncbi:MAG: hypothetical protein H0T71_07370 [Acidobacteria bacterium]|nr:hypothetical protein [Acidobacteriota bacterium]
MTSHEKRIDFVRPPVDEWGIYDPEQAGLAAVLERLEVRRRAVGVSLADALGMAGSMRDTRRLAHQD